MAKWLTDKDFRDRFWARVQKGDCWEWIGSTNHDGYGNFNARQGGLIFYRAHRFSWHINKGPMPPGIDVCHKCDHPPCVNPDHLFLGTMKDNVADREAKGRGATVGASNANAKLTENQVWEILESNATTLALGKKYEVHPTVISNIRLGKKWSSLTGIKYNSTVTYPNKAAVLPQTETQMEADGETDAVALQSQKFACLLCQDKGSYGVTSTATGETRTEKCPSCSVDTRQNPEWRSKCKGCQTPIPTGAKYCGDCFI